MGYAFISYSSKNQQMADFFRTLFNQNGIETWMAPGDIPFGSTYTSTINRAIKDSSCFVLLLSESAQGSSWVLKETECAISTGKTIFTVLIDDVSMNDDFEFMLSTSQAVAIRKIDESDDKVKRLILAIKMYTGEERQANHKFKENKNTKLSIISLPGSENFTNSINNHLVQSKSCLSVPQKESYIVPSSFLRSNTGSSKCIIEENIKDCDLFLICDLYNCSCTYLLRGHPIPMNLNDHYANLKNAIATIGEKSNKTTVIAPMLYDGMVSDNDRRNLLNDILFNLNVDSVITFDTCIDNVKRKGHTNLYPYKEFASALLKIAGESIFDKNVTFAVLSNKNHEERINAYSRSFNLDWGFINKKYDYTITVNRMHPVIDMELSHDISGYQNIILVTEIASSERLLACCQKIKEYGDKKIYILATFGVFSDGLEYCDKAYSDNLFNKIICTNLTHTDDELRNREWYMEVDMSKTVANIINNLHNDISL